MGGITRKSKNNEVHSIFEWIAHIDARQQLYAPARAAGKTTAPGKCHPCAGSDKDEQHVDGIANS